MTFVLPNLPKFPPPLFCTMWYIACSMYSWLHILVQMRLYYDKLITFLLITQGIIKSVINSRVANSIDSTAGSSYNIEASLHQGCFDISVAEENIAAEGTCDKK